MSQSLPTEIRVVQDGAKVQPVVQRALVSQEQLQRYISVCLFGPDCISVPIAPPIAEEEEEEQVMQPEDVLRPLKEDQVEKLLQVLATDLPDSSVPYNWIKKQTEWAKKLPEIKVSILCPDGDWSDGTVVTMVDGLGEKIVFGTLYTLEKGGAKLKKALTETKLIPWHRFSHFSGVHVRHIPICVEILSAVGVNLHTGNLYVPCHMHYASAEDAANIEIPELAANVRVGPLDLSHVDTVCKYWPHYSADYRRVVEKMVELNPSCGVFVRNEDGAEELAAMIVQSEYGGLGILQTVPEHRRKGYALTALRHQARALGRAGVSPHCHVIVDNYRSVELFKKSGLKPVALTNWVCAKRKEDRTLL